MVLVWGLLGIWTEPGVKSVSQNCRFRFPLASLRKDSLRDTDLFSCNPPLLVGPAFRLQENLNKRMLWKMSIKTAMCIYFKNSDVALWYFFMALNNSVRVVKFNLSWEFLGIAMVTSWSWILVNLKKYNVVKYICSVGRFCWQGCNKHLAEVNTCEYPVCVKPSTSILQKAKPFPRLCKSKAWLSCGLRVVFSSESWLREVTYIIPWRTPKGEIWQALKGPKEYFGLEVYNFLWSLNTDLLENATHFRPDVSIVPWRLTAAFSLIAVLEEGAGVQPHRWCGACAIWAELIERREEETQPHTVTSSLAP